MDELKRRVSEAQDSLAIALARIQTYKSRENMLLRDNQALRKALAKAGVQDVAAAPRPLQPSKPSSSSPMRDCDGAAHLESQTGFAREVPQDSLPSSLYVSSYTGRHPAILLHTEMGKVPGAIVATDDCIDFVEIKSRIAAAEFVGVRSISAGAAALLDSGCGQNGKPGRPTRWRSTSSLPVSWLLGAQKGPPGVTDSGCLVGGPDHSGCKLGSISSESSPPSTDPGMLVASLASIGDRVGQALRHSWNGGPEDASLHSSVEGSGSDPGSCARANGDGAEPAGPHPRAPAHQGGCCQNRGVEGEEGEDRAQGDGPWGVWEILWKAGAGEGPLQRRTFEASTATRTFLHKWVENWQQGGGSESGIRSPVAAPGVHGAPGAAVGGEAAAADLRAALEAVAAEGTLQQGRQDADDPGEGGVPHLEPPVHLSAEGALWEPMAESSELFSESQAHALIEQLPPRFRQSHWRLLYGTSRHGISLQTLYRRCAGAAGPCITVVRDLAGYVFGAYTSLPWRVQPSFYGNGETFVFQLKPHMVAWHWKRSPGGLRNDFFQYSAPDTLGAGGAGAFALALHEDLQTGSSAYSDSFGSPGLAFNEEFRVGAVEVWGLS